MIQVIFYTYHFFSRIHAFDFLDSRLGAKYFIIYINSIQLFQEWKIHINETIPVGSSGFWSVHVYKKRSGKLCPNAKKFNINSYNHKPNVGESRFWAFLGSN